MTELGWLPWTAAVVAGLGTLVSGRERRRSAARVARASHELRGALSALGLGLELAHRRALSAERASALRLQLRRAGAALDDLSGLAGERVFEPVDVAELIHDSVEALRPLANRRGSELRALQSPPVIVFGVRGCLAQALGNLIQNALEHGAGPVTVQARAGDRLVRLEILDDGGGLDRPLEELLRGRRRARFRPAHSAAGLQPRAHANLHGHGLAVAAAVAGAHGGRLLSAPSDRGARLVLELPTSAEQHRGGSLTGIAP